MAAMVDDMTESGAIEHLDRLASKYTGRAIRFFGDAIPGRFSETETPVRCRIRPTHVVAGRGSGSPWQRRRYSLSSGSSLPQLAPSADFASGHIEPRGPRREISGLGSRRR
jgi:hypothetical protein